MLVAYRAVMLLLCVGLLGGVGAQYGPDPPDTPTEFKCAWRQLAAEYAHLNRPDAAAKVHDALQLSRYCPDSPRPDEASLPVVFPPPLARAPSTSSGGDAGGVYVDAMRGSDMGGTGSAAKPYATIQKAVDVGAGNPPPRASPALPRL
jgi:hypothetical protein